MPALFFVAAVDRFAHPGKAIASPDAVRRPPGDANGSRECAPDDRLRVVRSRCTAGQSVIRRSPTMKRRVTPQPVIGPRVARTR
jgi:hypothetical protein